MSSKALVVLHATGSGEWPGGCGLGSNTAMQSPPRPEVPKGQNVTNFSGPESCGAAVVAQAMGASYAVNPLTPERTSRGDNFGPFGCGHMVQLSRIRRTKVWL